MTIKEIVEEQDFDKKGNLIKIFAKNNSLPKKEEIRLIKNYLFHKDYFLREAAVYALFFKWEISEFEIFNFALKLAIDENEDFDVRKWLFSSFPKIYNKTNDIKILKITYEVFKNSQDDLVRTSALRALLEIYGIAIKDILLKEIKNNVHFNKGSIDSKIELFKNQLKDIENLIKEQTRCAKSPAGPSVSK